MGEIKTPYLVLSNGGVRQLALPEFENEADEQKVTKITADEVAAVLASTGTGWLGTKQGTMVNTINIVEITDVKPK